MTFIPVSEISICYAESLEPGDFAIVHDLEDQMIFVADAGRDRIALFLDNSEPGSITTVGDLRGIATVVKGAEFEVDHRSVSDIGDRAVAGSLVTDGGNIAFVLLGSRGNPVRYPVAKIDVASGVHRNVRFGTWRIIKRLEEEKIILFQRSAGPDAQPGRT